MVIIIVASAIILGIILLAQVQANRFSPKQSDASSSYSLSDGAKQVSNGNPVIVLREGEGTSCIQLLYINHESNFTQIYLYSGMDPSGELGYSSHIVEVGKTTEGMGNPIDARLLNLTSDSAAFELFSNHQSIPPGPCQ